jgi:hypothetical protein
MPSLNLERSKLITLQAAIAPGTSEAWSYSRIMMKRQLYQVAHWTGDRGAALRPAGQGYCSSSASGGGSKIMCPHMLAIW